MTATISSANATSWLSWKNALRRTCRGKMYLKGNAQSRTSDGTVRSTSHWHWRAQ